MTVTQVVTSASQDNMVMTLTLYNHTAATSYADLGVMLTDPDGNTYRATGGLRRTARR